MSTIRMTNNLILSPTNNKIWAALRDSQAETPMFPLTTTEPQAVPRQTIWTARLPSPHTTVHPMEDLTGLQHGSGNTVSPKIKPIKYNKKNKKRERYMRENKQRNQIHHVKSVSRLTITSRSSHQRNNSPPSKPAPAKFLPFSGRQHQHRHASSRCRNSSRHCVPVALHIRSEWSKHR